jgi:hypothetical protein
MMFIVVECLHAIPFILTWLPEFEVVKNLKQFWHTPSVQHKCLLTLQVPRTEEDLVMQRDIEHGKAPNKDSLSTSALAGIITVSGIVAFGALLLLVLCCLQKCRKRQLHVKRDTKRYCVPSTPGEPLNGKSELNGSSFKSKRDSKDAFANSSAMQRSPNLESPMAKAPVHKGQANKNCSESFADSDPYVVYTKKWTGEFESQGGQPPRVQNEAAGEQCASLQLGCNGTKGTKPTHARNSMPQTVLRCGNDSPQAYLPFIPQGLLPSNPIRPSNPPRSSSFRAFPEIMATGTDSMMSSQRVPGANQALIMQSFCTDTNKDRLQSSFNVSAVGTLHQHQVCLA